MSKPLLQLTDAVLPIRRDAPPFDFAASAGENWMLVGPLGGGRTTFLKVLAMLIRLASGHYACLGNDVSLFAMADRRRARAGLGLCLEADGLVESWSVFDNLAVLPRYHRRGRTADIEDQVWAYIAAHHEMPKIAYRGVAGLKREERRGIALLRAHYFDPPVLLLDGIAPDDVGEFGLTAAFRHRLEAPGRVVVRQTNVDQARGRNGPEDRLAVMIDGRPVAQGHPGTSTPPRHQRRAPGWNPWGSNAWDPRPAGRGSRRPGFRRRSRSPSGAGRRR